MDLDDAYGWLAVPAKLLVRVEETLSQIGVPVSPWVAQSIVFVAAAILAACFWVLYIRTAKTTPARLGALVAALGLTAVSAPIPIFWGNFVLAPPRGEIVGRITSGDAAGWKLTIIDNRQNKIANATIDHRNGLFTAYYTPTLGQFPARYDASRSGCATLSDSLSRETVFGDQEMDLELICKSPSQ